MKQVLPRFRRPTRFLSCDLATAAARLARFDGTAFSDEDEPALSHDCERFRARVPPPLLLHKCINMYQERELYCQKCKISRDRVTVSYTH